MLKKKFSLKYTSFWIILLFLALRFIINLENNPLTIAFAVIYGIFILLLIIKNKYFILLLLGFLVIDLGIGTFLLYKSVLPLNLYIGTIVINFLIILLLIKYPKNFVN